jgi:hypothetical protein
MQEETGDLKHQLERFQEEIRQWLNHQDIAIEEINEKTNKQSECLEELHKDSKEIIALFKSWSGMLDLWQRLGKFLKPLAVIAALVTALGSWLVQHRPSGK